MKKIFLLLLITTCFAEAQITISGTINAEKKPLSGANIILENTYDGATSDADGSFSFETFEKGEFTLKIVASEFDEHIEAITIQDKNIYVEISLNEMISLKTVVFTAGQMSVKSETNKAMMKPLDVVTTAGSLGDNIGALQTLPGTQTNGEDGRLFVRGGDPNETETYIDGMKVFQPYTPTSPNTPVRGRFSPFLFKGINFSTGGFGVKFGDAMSGILDMNTIDLPKDNSVNLSLMTVGAGAAFNKSWDKSSLSFNGAYTHLGLYNAIFESRDEWIKSPQSYAGELVYRQKFGKALWKTYLAYDGSDLELNQFHINAPNGEFFGLNNKNLYANSSVNIPVFKKSDLLLGGSLGTSKNNFNLDGFLLEADAYGVFGRAELNSKLARNFRLIAGSSIDHERLSNTTENGHSGANNLLWNAYTEAQWTFAPRFGIKGGLRSTYSSMLEKWYLQPRAELAFQLSANQNLSLAYGKFAQMPSSEYWISAEKMGFQSANQVMLNYLFQGEKNILRAEIYHKTYQDLVTYNSQENNFYNGLGNDGKGYANGLDVFWRNDNDLIPALDFWVSYSYLDSERLYQDFPVEAQPAYVSKHNLNWVNKYWINSLRSQLGVTYNFTSGRPYTNPNSNEFLGERMKVYHTVDLGWSYLISQQKILYISVSNVFNFKNEFGRRYSSVPNAQGFFDSEPIVAQNNQFFFVGFFWTISTDKSKNQLDNL